MADVPVPEAFVLAVETVLPCTCHGAYRARQMIAPDCAGHEAADLWHALLADRGARKALLEALDAVPREIVADAVQTITAKLDEVTELEDAAVAAWRTRAEKAERERDLLRKLLVFADGAIVTWRGTGLADLYAEDCDWAQETLAAAGCWPRGHRTCAALADTEEATDG